MNGPETDPRRDPVEDPKAPTRRRSPIRFLARLWPYMRPYRSRLALAGLALLLAAAATLVLPMTVRVMIDGGFAEGGETSTDLIFLQLFIVAAAMGIFASWRYYLVTWLGERVIADLRSGVYRHLLGLHVGFFEDARTGELLSRLNTDTTLIQTVVGSGISIALRSGLMLVGSAVLLVLTAPGLAAMMLLVLPAVMLPIMIFGRRLRKLSRESQDRIADFSAVGSETINAVPVVQAFAREDHERQRFNGSVEAAFQAARKRTLAGAFMSLTVILLVFGALVLVLRMGAGQVMDGSMTPGTLGQFVLYSVFGASSVGALTEVWGDVQRAAGALERIIELLAERSRIASPEVPRALPSPLRGELAIRNVSYAYPSHPDRTVLHELDLVIEPGENVALVGPSGAGKSTVFQLLLRFRDPTAGVVELDGVEVRELALADYRRVIGLVPQETVVFSSSLYDNIRYGAEDADRDAVMAAARLALVDEFAERLVDGYDTLLGERGVRLSGGQRQRIAIARALVKNPPVLLLDEATSSLDSDSERSIQQALDRSMAGRTTLVIAHRLATVKKADRIVVMDEGRVVAQGRHEELVADDGLYRRLARLQFAEAAERQKRGARAPRG
jgi:ATP-binding cassette subfamily B protein